MGRRYYSNLAEDTTLTSGIDSTQTSLVVDSADGWPSTPFSMIIDPGTADEEVILVGTKSGTTFDSLSRGWDGTTGKTHQALAIIKHTIIAADLREVFDHRHKPSEGHTSVEHADITNQSADDHHSQSHLHNGSDGSGVVDHTHDHEMISFRGWGGGLTIPSGVDTDVDLLYSTDPWNGHTPPSPIVYGESSVDEPYLAVATCKYQTNPGSDFDYYVRMWDSPGGEMYARWDGVAFTGKETFINLFAIVQASQTHGVKLDTYHQKGTSHLFDVFYFNLVKIGSVSP